ncbi:MAG: hypothetical protein ILO34_07215 [Kiritimatiellae bacterium]|nr:hypothetical protein [Kiritimatiellia bacterium]
MKTDKNKKTTRVVVEKPLRIDLAGGWSDTPPICNILGGCVLNMAVKLNGKLPVKVAVERIAGASVIVESVDLRKRGEYRSDREIAKHDDPRDWGCLVKSALTVVGYKLREGGLHIRISADVPKGSGLGTSSILGAALVEALGKVLGRDYTWRDVGALTLEMEREMRTGGGWQDQIGGLLPGVKLISSSPGDEQRLRVRRLDAASSAAFSEFLSERALLYFTGQKRMARNVLRGVVGFFGKNPDGIAHAIVSRLKRDASAACKAIEKGDWAALCAAINGYWLSKKALDPGSTNPLVESLVARMAPWIDAVTLCGAGGGGFMLAIARDTGCRRKIRRILESQAPRPEGRFYDFSIA